MAIASIGSVGTMNVTAGTVQMNFHPPVDQLPSAAALAARNALATADAVALGPLASTEAQEFLDQARDLADEDPLAALALYRDVQDRLVAAGFAGHAAEFDQRVAALCVATGDEATAIRLLMDALWTAEAAGDSMRAASVLRMLNDLAGFPEFGPTRLEEPRSPALSAAANVADFVADHLQAPVPQPIEFPWNAVELLEPVDRARTTLFAAEHALGNDNSAWIVTHQQRIMDTADTVADDRIDIAVRLRLAAADGTGEWAALLRSARAGMPRELKALTMARYGRYQLFQAAPAEADGAWSDAIGEACLAERNADAADWLYNQRFVSNRYRGIAQDTWHPLAQALSDLPSKPKIITSAADVRERAFSALHYDRPRVAAINLRRQLLEGIRSASVPDELEARRLLGEIYCETEELDLAAFYTIGGGDYEEVPKVAAALGDAYLDVTQFMPSPLSWVSACALQFATEQADLIPDGAVETVVGLALAVITDVKVGARLDSPVLSPQMTLSAYGLLAALVSRLSVVQATEVLDLLAGSVDVEKHHYRRTDGSHIALAAGICRAHTGELHERALAQLIGLYERGAHPFATSARDALLANLDDVGDRLLAMAEDGHREAAALLALEYPDQVSAQDSQAATARLQAPTSNGPNRISTGTGAIGDSLLAASLPAEVRIQCIEMLLSNASSLWEPATNRDDYLLAAGNLVDDLDEDTRQRFFIRALDFASNPPRSEADAMNQSLSSPLGAMRVKDGSDCRPAATFLAGRLAKSAHEKHAVRDTALRLIGVGSDDDYRVTTTLQLVQSELGDSIGLLAQASWTLRSLAAILWAESPDTSDNIGVALSRDSDVRVRRALATAISRTNNHRNSEVWQRLRSDSRWSVRSIMTETAATRG